MIDLSHHETADKDLTDTRGDFAELNIGAALQRALVLNGFRLVQDLVCRVTMLIVLISSLILAPKLIAACSVILFCAMWFISRERLSDTVARIETGFVVGAQKARETSHTAKWEYFMGVLGSRATSVREIAFFEMALRSEPVVWGLIGVILILLRKRT